MSEETVAAVSSAEPVATVMDISRGPLVDITPEQRADFRKTGDLPTPKKEEAAPSSEASGEAKPTGDSEPLKKTQENTDRKPKQTAEERIAQLEATIEKIRKGAGKETQKVESSPTKPETAKPIADKEPAPEDQNQDGTPKYKTYEEFTKAQARWEVRQELAEQRKAEQTQAQAKEFNSVLEKARERYPTFDEVVSPFATAINTDPQVSPAVKQMLLDSEILSDVLFTIGSNAAESASFLKMAKENPGKALRYIALTESLIAEELAGKSKPVEEAPVKPKTQAPKPPSEAGGRAAAPPDALEAAAKANDFRSFKAEATRRAIAKLKS